MFSKIPRKFQNLFLAIFFIFLAIFSHFLQNYFSSNISDHSHSEQKISQTSGLIEATKERVNAILSDEEVQKTIERIEKDEGKYNKDGAVFMNREKILPVQSDREYYSEWTIKTPWDRTRWARRIVEWKGGELYFTDDHYRSFVRIR